MLFAKSIGLVQREGEERWIVVEVGSVQTEE